MIQQQWKQQRVFWPFVRVVAGILVGFVLLDGWWNARAVVGAGLLWVAGLPAGLLLLWQLVYQRPWLRYLREDRSNNGGRSGYASFYFIAVLTTGTLTWLLDDYLGQALAPVARLNEVAQLRQRPPARFYLLRRASINPRLFGCDSSVEYRKGAAPRVHFRIVSPLLARPADTLSGVPAAWLGFSYTENFAPDSPPNSPDALAAVCQRLRTRFARSRPAELLAFGYLERAGTDAASNSYELAARSVVHRQPGAAAGVPLVLLPRYKPFGQRTARQPLYLLGAALLGVGLFWLNLVLTQFKTEDELAAD